LLWSSGVASEIIRPMAAPVLGGILVADEVIDLFLPILFYWVRLRRWNKLHARNQAVAVDTQFVRASLVAFDDLILVLWQVRRFHALSDSLTQGRGLRTVSWRGDCKMRGLRGRPISVVLADAIETRQLSNS